MKICVRSGLFLKHYLPVMMQKSYTRGVCLCFSSQCLVVTTGCCSVLLSLAALLPCVFLLVSSSAWELALKTARQWLDKGEVGLDSR